MKDIIFLDVDGILNSFTFLKKESIRLRRPLSGKKFPFDPSCLNCLCYLISETDAEIIITSSWRKYENHLEILMNKLAEYDLARHVYGFNPITGNLAEEIQLALNQLGTDTNYVILNDKHTNSNLDERLIQTDSTYGLTYEDVLKAINILKSRSRKF